ncbi:hypothetical protein ACM16X_02355 [Haloarcula japonica]|uniref:hypothetical protein n=1 Tax=Haloarcula japonica TaxID=29282 RepID=UPI0039F6A853
MRFDFEEPGKVVDKIQDLKKHLDDPYRGYVYEASIESEGTRVLDVLTDLKCKLTVLEEDGETGELDEIFLFPILPLEFDIRLRRTGNLVNRFQKYVLHLDMDDLRLRLSASSRAGNPADALRELRQEELVLVMEEENGDGYEKVFEDDGLNERDNVVESSAGNQ